MADRRRQNWRLLLAVGTLLLLFSLVSIRQGWLSGLDQLLYDEYVRQMDMPVSERIVIVAVDPKSLSRLGRWPWPRRFHAELLEILSRAKPAVVAMDINFAEPDRQHPEDDRFLMQAMAENGRVVLPVVVENSSVDAGLVETHPMPMLMDAVAALGHVDTELDSDGIARSAFLMAGLNRARWPALALAMLEVSGEWPEGKPLPGERDTADPQIRSAGWRRDYRVLVPFPRRGKGIRQVSFVDVLERSVEEQLFNNKYVLVGATATGLGDNIPTPMSALGKPVAGVEFNAAVVNALLQNRMILPVSQGTQHLALVAVILLVMLLYYLHARRYGYWIGLLLLLVLAADYLVLARFQFWYPPMVVLFSILLSFLVFNWHQLRKLLRALFEERRLSQAALTSIGEAVIHLDERGRIRKFNPMAEKLSGVSARDAERKPVNEIFNLVTARGGKPISLERLIRLQRPSQELSLELRTSGGEKHTVHLAFTPIPGDAGQRNGAVLVLSDVSREQELAAAVSHRETHNILTDLPNQNLMVNQLSNALRRAAVIGAQVAVVHLDIDRFTKINEALGIESGNRLLQAVADRLQAFGGGRMAVGHIGGDEFLLILEGKRMGESIREMVKTVYQQFNRPLHVGGRELRLSFTLGVSVFPENGDDPELLIRRASTAMHRGKEQHRGQISYFTPGMQDRVNRTLEIESLLHQALDSGGIEVFFQPLIQADDLKIVAVEALARLRDRQGRFVEPEEFIPVAEESGLITEMGHQQLHESCVQLENWRRLGYMLRLSYNFSPRQLNSPDLLERLTKVLKLTGVDPGLIEFEITENLLLSNDELVLPVLNGVQDLGVGLVIDDFGTGYSSMNYLTRFHFDRLKIDKSFIWDLSNRPGSRAIISAIVSMAHDLDMEVVAEGVETKTQYEILRSLGCDELQGYYLGMPMSGDDFMGYLSANKGFASP